MPRTAELTILDGIVAETCADLTQGSYRAKFEPKIDEGERIVRNLIEAAADPLLAELVGKLPGKKEPPNTGEVYDDLADYCAILSDRHSLTPEQMMDVLTLCEASLPGEMVKDGN